MTKGVFTVSKNLHYLNNFPGNLIGKKQAYHYIVMLQE